MTVVTLRAGLCRFTRKPDLKERKAGRLRRTLYGAFDHRGYRREFRCRDPRLLAAPGLGASTHASVRPLGSRTPFIVLFWKCHLSSIDRDQHRPRGEDCSCVDEDLAHCHPQQICLTNMRQIRPERIDLNIL